MTDRPPRFLLTERIWADSDGRAKTAPILINLDHVRHAAPAPIDGQSVIWWAHQGLTPVNVAMDFATLTTHVNHAASESP